MREASLDLAKEGVTIDVIIKGAMDFAVLNVVSRPTGMKIVALPRWLILEYLFFYLAWHKAAGTLSEIIVSKESMRRFARIFGHPVRILREKGAGYEII